MKKVVVLLVCVVIVLVGYILSDKFEITKKNSDQIDIEVGEKYFDMGSKAYKENDINKAFKMFEKSCDAGYMDGCVTFGGFYYEGKGVAQDHKKALEIFKKACNKENKGGCYGLALLYKTGSGVSKDKNKAQEYFKKSCDLGYDSACKEISNEENILSQKVPENFKEAEREFKNNNFRKARSSASKACEEEYLEGCGMLGYLLSADMTEMLYKTKNEVEKKDLREKFLKVLVDTSNLCLENGSKYACKVGRFILLFSGGKMNEMTFNIFQKSCELDAKECDWVASFYKEGEYVSKDLRQAKIYYKKACNAGNENSCENYRKLN